VALRNRSMTSDAVKKTYPARNPFWLVFGKGGRRWMCVNMGGVMKTGVTAVLDGQWFVGEGKLARVNEEKGKELGANLDEIRAQCPSRQPHQNLPANQRSRESQ
jgi:hypothetical protein